MSQSSSSHLSSEVQDLIRDFQDKNILKFGNFTLRSGKQSPVYLDLRKLVAYPEILSKLLTEMLVKTGYTSDNLPDQVCGVAYTGIPMATIASLTMERPMIMIRKERKKHGTGQIMEGEWQMGQQVLLIDDVITSGTSLVEAVRELHAEGLVVNRIVVFMDRRSPDTRLPPELQDIPIYSVCTLDQILDFAEINHQSNEPNLKRRKTIQSESTTFSLTHQVIASQQGRLPYNQRIDLIENPLAKSLLRIMQDKQTNLALSADLFSTGGRELLDLAERCGPYICMLKIHWETMNEHHDEQTLADLADIAKQHNFILLEDRKFSDIGNTVQAKLAGWSMPNSDYIQAVTAQSVSGPGILQAFNPTNNDPSVFLIAQMSTQGNLTDCPDYVQKTVDMARDYPQTVAGFICQEQVSDQSFLHVTPGVKLQHGTDSLGQKYRTPNDLFASGTDIMIVGRGIISQSPDNWVNACQEYQRAGWEAYVRSLNTQRE